MAYLKSNVYDWLAGITNFPDDEPFNIVEVKFKGASKEFFVNSENLDLKQEDIVIVQATTGHDIGIVTLTGELVRLQMKKKDIQINEVVYKIYRIATSSDCKKWKESKELESKTMYQSRALANELNLKMKICDVAYQGDLTSATFYYTAENRIDFRELIVVLAKTFDVKIVMRQITQIEEVRRLGGIGSCGREYCFSSWQTYKRSKNKQWSEFKCCLLDEPKNNKISSNKNNFENIQTLKGIAIMQKKDSDNKIIWYSYPNENRLIPITRERAKELQMLIMEGMILKDLLDEAAIIEKYDTKKVIPFKNAMSQDSITRFDKKNKKP